MGKETFNICTCCQINGCRFISVYVRVPSEVEFRIADKDFVL